jgi:WD40 repeat protein/sterol desaturase/sphingolipid hydroxylase (fatty acid hydroxylase superfamily)
MDWLVTIGDFWLNTLAWLTGFAIAFGILARLTPCNPGMYWWKDLRAAAVDSLYWFVVPLFMRIGRTLLLIAGLLLFFGGRDPEFLPVKNLPLWQQGMAILLIQDVLLYWLHRLFHTRLAWKFHAIHHSPKVLDWMSAARFHPINQLLAFSFADVAVLLMGFSPMALLALAPFNVIYSALVHANLNWTFGPLRYVFASPVFHRWHHTSPEEGGDKNFASTFPFLDLLFGTFYMPAGKLPEEFGVAEHDFPEGFWGQFIHPFKRPLAPASGERGWGEGAGLSPSPPTPLPRVQGRGEKSAGRQPSAALTAVISLAVVGLLGGGMVFMAFLAERSEQRARERAQVQLYTSPTAISSPNMLRDLVLPGHTGAVLGVALSADGQRLVSGSEDRTVKVWDVVTGQEMFTLTGHTRPVRSVAISADGQCLVSGSFDKTVKVWDARRGQEMLTLTGHTGGVLSVAVSADGRRIVSGAGDFTTKVWDAATGRELSTLTGPPGAVLSVALSADGARVASANWETTKIWDGQSGQEIFTLRAHTDLVYGVVLSPDGKHLVSGSMDKTVKVWDVTSGEEIRTLTGHTGAVYSVGLSANGRRIVSGSDDRTVKVWDAATGRELHTLSGHADSVTSVAVSADGRRIASGSRDGTVKVWTVPEGQSGATNAAPIVR